MKLRRPAAALALCTLTLAVTPAAASAHAQLEATVPQRGAVVATQPNQVVFRFDEPVEGTFGAVRVYDSKGARVDSGDAFHPGGKGPQIGVHLKPHLPQGSYTATYRVISADGHVVSSGFVFSIGHGGPAPTQTVGQLLSGSKTGAATEIAFGLARGLQYAALAAGLGGVLFLVLVWIGALRATAGGADEWRDASRAFSRRLRGALLAAAVVGVISAAAGVVLEGATASGISGFSALRPHIVRETLTTRFGTVWGLGCALWAIAGVAVLVTLAPRSRAASELQVARVGATGLALERIPTGRLVALVVPFALLTLVPVYAGHASTQHPTGVLFPTNLVHVVAMSLWTGGLLALLAVVPAATRRLGPPDRSRLLAANLMRFSTLALAAVIAILVTGLVQAYVYVRSVDNLVHTAFGRAVLIKFVLLLGLIALGAFNRRRSVPRLRAIAAEGQPTGRTGVLLRRALRAEVALIVVVLGVTAALTSYAPSIAAESGPFSATRMVGTAQMQITIDPARVGANEMHLYLINPKDGTQFTGAKEVDVADTMPAKGIGPLHEKANLAGPGHYIVPGALLTVPGTWKVQVTVRTSEFDEHSTTMDVHVR